MKKNIIFSLLIALLFCGWSYSQVAIHKLVSIGYTYQNQSFGELGGKLLFLKNDDVIFRAGASALLGNVNGEFVVLPKVQGDVLLNLEKNVDFYHSYYFFGGVDATTKYIAPKIGATLFGILDFSLGYAFCVDNSGIKGKKPEGLNMNFTLNLPTVMIHDLLK